MNKQNHARKFNSIMCTINEQWAGKVLNTSPNTHKGPDLIDDNKFVEIKFAIYPNPKDYVKWTILEYQTNYQKQHPNKTGFWGLGTYELQKPISQIKTQNPTKLEELVVSRRLIITNWDWIFQFESYHNSGKTHLSEWDHSLRHAKFNKLPKMSKTYIVEKGEIYLAENVNETYFKEINTQ